MAVKLEEYNQKRDFEKTLEPEGVPAGAKGELRFVVQHHMARRDHYDFRLEWDGALLSWAVPKGPSYNTRDKRLAIQVEPHPLEYRNFEGTIPKGEYGGGTVMLWDEGRWDPQVDVSEGLSAGSLKFILNGRRLKGRWALVRMKARAGETRDNWLLLKEKDEYAGAEEGIEKFATSIRTGRTMAEIEAGENEKIIRNPFSQTDVQLAKLVDTVPKGEDWLYELKYDGYRILAYIENNDVRLITRNGNDYKQRFEEVASSLRDWSAGRAMVLDGEMVIADATGKTDFHALQNYMRNPQSESLFYMIFDLLALDGKDLRERRLLQRKEMLEALMKDAPPNLHFSQHIRGNGQESLLAACRMDLEGIIGKKADSIYSGTRNGDWIKLKCRKRQEFVIGGYTLSNKRAEGISSLLLGAYEGGAFIYAGRAGTGLRQSDIDELGAKSESLKRTEPPFAIAPGPRPHETITWFDPVLVAEIEFAEWTKDNLLRQASFKGLRADKDPLDVKKEKAEGETGPEAFTEELERPMETNGNSIVIEGIKITSPDKVVFDGDPTITKADVIRYYAQVSERMLPYVTHRILSIVRCPKGISQSCFYKKHPGPGSKGIVTMPVTNSDGETEDYFYIENATGLIYEAQMGTLEFHAWGSRVEALEKPDIMVFDLDPDEGMGLDLVRRGVRDIKNVLAELSLISYLKTSGGKGYHVVVPLKPAASWDVFYDFAKGVAGVMEQKWPDRYTSNVRKAKRVNKIFIDWIRNGRGATSVSPYSIRAREGARVSMPITWDELDTVAPNGISLADALVRLAKDDPWKDFFLHDQFLK
ncbi:MAG: DNA ligase D [Candidatus Pelethousia sp.]|nr:DNA ligase D [Candidatus Pelethousia sp.]